jgi:four helix bundle protein
MKERDLKRRTKKFAHRCVKLSRALPQTALGDHIRKQIIRCSTSAALNYQAACVAQSEAVFASNLSVAVEETDESCFWMQFIIDEELINERKVTDLLEEAKELTAIFIKSRKAIKDRNSEFAAEKEFCEIINNP